LPNIVVVVDTSKVWEAYAVREHTVVVVSPSSELAGQVRALAPARVIVNLAVPGALESLAALHDGSRPLPVWGVVADTVNERVLGLGTIDAVGRPPTAEALVAAVDRQAPRGARVFAAGRDADALMKMRQVLAKQGFSVSMARDTKQIAELLAMVKPQLVVVDLQLPMREGYELIMRVTSLSPIPSVIVIPPDGDPAATLADKLRERLASGQGMGAKQWLTDLLARKISAVEHRPKSTSVAAHPH
ncbi:MAG: response regulator, partial [Candidatus Binatia bacterium]